VVREVPTPVDGGAPASVPRRVRPLTGERFDPAAIYASRAPGVVTIYAFFDGRAAQGSGFVVSGDGLILTNSHVITEAGGGGDDAVGARQVYVEFQDRDRIPAKIVGFDVFDDVGVLRVDPRVHSLTPLPLGDSSRVRVGEPVAAIGSPFGNENSLAVGVVSATRSIASLTSRYNLPDAIQVDAPINHGNSGGPLFDARGRVIGINAQIRSDSGTAEGVGFAVPINAARRSMTQLVATGRVAYAYVGISTEDLTPSLARRFGYPVRYGAVITSVRPGTPGARAGLRGGNKEREFAGTAFTVGGDVVLAVDRTPIRSAEDVVRAVVARRPGQRVVFTILRGRDRLRVPLVLGERPKNPDSGR
jgi:S1-C subfamily serine protease